MDSITSLLRELKTQKSQTNLNRRSNLLRDNYYLYIYLLKASMYKTNSPIPCENEVGFIGTVLELSGTHFNGTFWDNHLIPINPNIGIIWN